MAGTTTASSTASPSVLATSAVSPDSASEKPPFSPSAISRYSERKREIWGGISRLDLTVPAIRPKTKNRMAGSSRLGMAAMLGVLINN